ncbi:MAG: hypothetical protein M1826_007371 [Phylliscum demangeonii]|nr:MAG: hypothetical protein M1826_007371 [Phylliscum demangeonii]
MQFPIPFAFLLAPLLLGQAVALPSPLAQETTPPPRPRPPHPGAWNALSATLGGAGLLAAVRSWRLSWHAQAQLALRDQQIQTLQNQMLSLLGHTRNQLETGRRELGTSVHELRRSTRQGMRDLHQRIDGIASPRDGHPTSDPAEPSRPPFRLSQLRVEDEALDLVLRQHPHLWSCAVTWLKQRHAVREDNWVEVVDWNEAADQCDREQRFPQLRPQQASLGWFMPMPAAPATSSMFSVAAHMPARLHRAAQRSMTAVAQAHLLAPTTVVTTEKNLAREEAQVVRLGV